MFTRVLVANRGEIAVRVIRALDELGIESVAVYSEADRDAQHVKRATEAHLLGPGPAAESYLNVDKLIEVIKASKRRGGPSRLRLPGRERRVRAPPRGGGDHLHRPARERDRRHGLEDQGARADAGRGRPDRPGHDRAGRDRSKTRRRSPRTSATRSRSRPRAAAAARASASRWRRTSCKDAFEGAAREGEKFFSDATVYLERYLPDPRHVEVQVLADGHGNVVHLGERDCSIQRRHQKLIEESPAPLVDEDLRERIGKIAVDAAQGRRLPRRGHDRGPAVRGRRVLLPGDEHPRAGRALRDRGGHRRRHRARADPDRRRRADLASARTTSAGTGTRSSAGSTPRTRRRTSRPRRARSRTTASRAARACGWTPACSAAPRSRRCMTRWSPS